MSELMDSYTFLNQGRTFEELPPGFRFRTGRRTITETDLMTFLNTCGFAEPLFYDHDKGADAHFKGLICPGALTYSIAEGLVVQTSVLMGTGMAFLHMELDVRKPVFAGDTIWVGVEITDSRPTSKPGRGLVSARNTVYNQRDEEVLVYTPVRLVRGRTASA